MGRVKRCTYCGEPTTGVYSCRYCRDLVRLERDWLNGNAKQSYAVHLPVARGVETDAQFAARMLRL